MFVPAAIAAFFYNIIINHFVVGMVVAGFVRFFVHISTTFRTFSYRMKS